MGRTTSVVTAGTITPATITVISEVLRPSTTVVHGTLRVSAEWGAEVGLHALRAGKRRTMISLDIDPTGEVSAWQEPTMLLLDEMTKVGEGEYRWGPTPLCAGRYQITVRGCEHRTIVPIGPEHPTEIAIVVPEPNEVRVRVLDAGSGQPIVGAAPDWTRRVAGWQGGWSPAPMRELGDGWYHFLAPVGDLEISVHPEGYGWVDTDHVVRPGSNEFVVRVDRVCGVEIVLKDGGVTLPWPDDAHMELEHATSKAGAAYWSGNKVAAEEPGEHTLTMQPLEGYLPIAPRRVVIEAAKWTPIVIELQRKP